MHSRDVAPVATDILVPAYLGTFSFSRDFTDEWGSPPTAFSKVHYMRSVMQVMVTRNDRFDLAEDFVEFGRVEFYDRELSRVYLLRNDSTVKVEKSKRQRESLFDAAAYLKTDVHMLVYKFRSEGLDLLVAGTERKNGTGRLVASGAPSYLGNWSYTPEEPATFDQGQGDAFAELGGMEELLGGSG